jgi:YHS domain-containing protein
MPHGKCRICKKGVTDKSINDGFGIVVNYNGKNMYFCCEEHCKQTMQELKKSEKWYKDRDDIDRFVKQNIFFYKDEQKLPKAFFDRLSDLGNGTLRCNGGSQFIRNGQKAGYPLEVILATFKSQRDNILYWFRNKSFTKESQKLNYMWSIIEGNINNEYEKWETEQMFKNKEKTKAEIIEQTELDNGLNKDDFVFIKDTGNMDMTDVFAQFD